MGYSQGPYVSASGRIGHIERVRCAVAGRTWPEGSHQTGARLGSWSGHTSLIIDEDDQIAEENPENVEYSPSIAVLAGLRSLQLMPDRCPRLAPVLFVPHVDMQIFLFHIRVICSTYGGVVVTEE